jgi:hypothetical protein
VTGLAGLIDVARAYAAKCVTDNRESMETTAGILLIGGFGLLGAALSVLV